MQRYTHLQSLHKYRMKTVFFCNLIWEMLIEHEGGWWVGMGGRGSVPLCSRYYDWLSRLAPVIHRLDKIERRGATDEHRRGARAEFCSRHLEANLSVRYLKGEAAPVTSCLGSGGGGSSPALSLSLFFLCLSLLFLPAQDWPCTKLSFWNTRVSWAHTILCCNREWRRIPST